MPDAIARAYELFSKYSADTAVHAADCAADSAVVEQVLSRISTKPLRELEELDLLDYFYLAIDHVGSVASFKHYLPRILELIARGGSVTFSLDVLLDKLRRGGAEEWPHEERAVLRDFFAALPSDVRASLSPIAVQETVPTESE